ncbi:MAG TPA: TIGR02594 family protein [Methyloceanibacter sp.]|nr:TIGR02594 family protein [Methyloceanibacter sp.]
MQLPSWYEFALAERGVKEAPGGANNPAVVAYYRDAGHAGVKHDSVPWCAAFVGAMLKRAGIKSSGSLLARSYLNWGKKLKQPRQGCIVVLKRGNSTWQGHIAFFDHEEGGRLVCLGGNQSDRVCFAPYATSRLLGFRWPS